MNTITIVEGQPNFMIDTTGWGRLFASDTDQPFTAAYCDMRTFNGQELQERCLRAWRGNQPAILDHPGPFGQRVKSDIVAVRLTQAPEGPVLTVWIKIKVNAYMVPD
jgi:hypothetical protein